jgi:hypothetical protein
VDDDKSDTESLEFQEEKREEHNDTLDETVSPSQTRETPEGRRRRGPTPTKRSTPPRTVPSDAAGAMGPRLTRVISAASSGLNKSPNRAGRNAVDEVLEGAAAQRDSRRASSPSKDLRRSPVIASGRFRLDPSSDAGVLQQQQAATRARSTTPVRAAGSGGQRSGRVMSPSRNELPEPYMADFGVVEQSLAAAPSTSDPSSRRCKWCKNVAPESHDDRCAMRKIRCKKCHEVLMLKERTAHACTKAAPS